MNDPFDFNPFEDQHEKLERVQIEGEILRPGDAVILRPGHGADVMDIALAGRAATIESIEQDFEDQIYVAVTIDDDPGRDFGAARKPAHRFFFRLEEVEPVAANRQEKAS